MESTTQGSGRGHGSRGVLRAGVGGGRPLPPDSLLPDTPTAGFGVLVLTPGGVVGSADAGAARILGVAADDLVAKSLGQVLGEVGFQEEPSATEHASLLDSVRDWTPAWGLALLGGGPDRVEYLFSPTRGEEDTAAGVLVLLRLEPRRDLVQAARASEERMRRLVEVGFLRVLTLSREGRVLRANRGALELLGFESEEQLLGWDFAEDLCAEPERGRFLLGRAPVEGKALPAEVFLRRAGEELQPVRVLVSAFRDARGEIRGTDLLLSGPGGGRGGEPALSGRIPFPDLVDRVRGGALHDFSNELSVIRVAAELLEAQLASGEAPDRNSLRPLLEATERAGRLSGRLMALTRPAETSPLVTNIAGLLKELSPLLRSAISEGVTLELEVEPDPPEVLVAPRAFERVVLMAATAAADALDGSGRIRFGIERVTSTAGTHGLVAVSTTFRAPEGSPGAEVPMLDPPSLDALRSSVWESGGITEVEHGEGGGLLRIVLPAARARDPGGAEPIAPGRDALKGRVLVVEDTREVREALVRVLERAGLGVRAVADGQEALDLYRDEQGSFDLVISDLRMPRVDGVRLLELLREEGYGKGFILLSGNTDSRGARISTLPGPLATLAKPWKVSELMAAARALLAGDPGAS